ncbi:MAG: RNA polymerase sigma factor [Candidatus Aminicenantes bacterium]|nr:RNA polymerase sigma factor [Candidatus Aminicenantes bacterium]
MTDNELVQSCLEGNMESYRTLMERYRGQAMALALNILANYQDAEDASQEAFLRAFRNLERFDLRKTFKNWFYTLLSRLCLDQVRRRRRFHRFIAGLRKEGEEAMAASSSNPGAVPGVDFSLLNRLRPKERAALHLWSQEGYSGAEIAAVLSCSQKTAYVHLFRARTKLKAVLKEEKDASS